MAIKKRMLSTDIAKQAVLGTGEKREAVMASLYEVLRGTTSIGSLSPVLRDLVINMIRDLRDNGHSELYRYLYEVDYKIKPPNINQFLTDKYFMKKVGDSLYPTWKRDIEYALSDESDFIEWIFSGCIGAGKSYVALVTQLFKACHLCCLKDPSSFYSLAAGSDFYFVFFNVTKERAQESLFSTMINMLKSSDFFMDQVSITGKKTVHWPNNIHFITAAAITGAISLNMFGGILDEMNFMRRSEVQNAKDIYNNVKRRMESRFMNLGRIPGILCLISSKKNVDDWLDKHIAEESEKTTVFVSSYAIWEVQPASKYCGEKFKVEVGDKSRTSRILGEGDVPYPGAQVINVPVEYLDQFKKGIEDSLRDYAGISLYAESPLITMRDTVFDCIDDSRKHPFTQKEIILDVKTDDNFTDYFLKDELVYFDGVRNRPIVNPSAQRFIHFDLAVTSDCVGITMGHCSRVIDISHVDIDKKMIISKEPEIYIDFMLRVRPPKNSEIDFSKLRSMVLYLSKLGFNIHMVTYDGFESVDSKQILGKQGYNVDIISVDRNATPYLTLKMAFSEYRVSMYDYDIVNDELLKLRRFYDKNKVDHPLDGSKDVSDSLAAVTYNITRSYRMGTLILPGTLFDEGINDPKSFDTKNLQKDVISNNNGETFKLSDGKIVRRR